MEEDVLIFDEESDGEQKKAIVTRASICYEWKGNGSGRYIRSSPMEIEEIGVLNCDASVVLFK